MKIKSLLILVLSLVTLTAFGQDGGIKGRFACGTHCTRRREDYDDAGRYDNGFGCAG